MLQHIDLEFVFGAAIRIVEEEPQRPTSVVTEFLLLKTTGSTYPPVAAFLALSSFPARESLPPRS